MATLKLKKAPEKAPLPPGKNALAAKPFPTPAAKANSASTKTKKC